MRIKYGSFFWPGVLILAGLIALLVNVGVIPPDRLFLLVNLWPLILIVIGLEIIVRRSVQGSAGDIVAAVIVLVALVAAAGYVAVGPKQSSATEQSSAALGDVKQASAEIDAGGATVVIEDKNDIGSDLYRASISYSGPKPDIRFDRSSATLTIEQNSNNFLGFQNPIFRLTLDVNPAVEWTINENTGASNDTINLPSTRLAALSINTGASREEITLGPARGIVPVKVDGGALTVHIHRASGTEVRIRVSGGAVSLEADGHNSHGIGELTYQSPGFAGASSYDITVDGGASTVTLDMTPGLD